MKIFPLVVGVAVVLAGGGVAAVSAASNDGPASEQDYVRDDGTIDMSLVPDTMMIGDENGNIIVDENGNPVLLDARKMLDATGEDPFRGRFGEPRAVKTLVENGKAVTEYEAPLVPREDMIREYRYDGK